MGLVEPSYFNYLRLAELCARAVFAAQATATILIYSILIVFISVTEKQMRRIATRWIVALMKNAQFKRDIAICQYPGNAMGKFWFSFKPKSTITACVRTGDKRPTFFQRARLDLWPKTYGRIGSKKSASLRITGCAAKALLRPTGWNVKGFAASFANTIGRDRLVGHWKLILSDVGHTLLKQGVAVCVVRSL